MKWHYARIEGFPAYAAFDDQDECSIIHRPMWIPDRLFESVIQTVAFLRGCLWGLVGIENDGWAIEVGPECSESLSEKIDRMFGGAHEQ